VVSASMLFEHGGNAKHVQRWLGHHSEAFTLATYVHLLSDELDEPLELPGVRDKLPSPGASPSSVRPTRQLVRCMVTRLFRRTHRVR
jgi:hypothetical protein